MNVTVQKKDQCSPEQQVRSGLDHRVTNEDSGTGTDNPLGNFSLLTPVSPASGFGRKNILYVTIG